MVLDIGKDEGPRPKCYVHHGHLPGYINSSHPPTKREPFRTIAEQRFNHTVDVILPLRDGLQDLSKLLEDGSATLRYAKVHMKLGEILTGDFFDEYVKKGNILMLAEGHSGTGNTFSLTDGVLRLEVDKATFEKAGLEGKVIPSEGRKHVKARYGVELDLRLPSMVHGKKGFERVIWACKNVFDHSMTWLFCDLNASTEGQGPVSAHAPLLRSVEPTSQTKQSVLVPRFPKHFSQEVEEDAADLLEWLSLVASGSPRILKTDRVDEYICRYSVPQLSEADGGQSPHEACDLVHYRWHGFIPSEFVTKVLLAVLKASGDNWFAVSATSFDGHKYTTLKHDDQVTTWKFAD